MLTLRQNAEQILKRAERSLMSFFVSQQWIIKFNTFAEPGPITNHDFLCQHGGKPSYIYQLVSVLIGDTVCWNCPPAMHLWTNSLDSLGMDGWLGFYGILKTPKSLFVKIKSSTSDHEGPQIKRKANGVYKRNYPFRVNSMANDIKINTNDQQAYMFYS